MDRRANKLHDLFCELLDLNTDSRERGLARESPSIQSEMRLLLAADAQSSARDTSELAGPTSHGRPAGVDAPGDDRLDASPRAMLTKPSGSRARRRREVRESRQKPSPGTVGSADGRLAHDGPSGRGTIARGMKIGRYQLIRELGQGGMGSVYLARDTRLGRRVALKFLHVRNSALTALFVTEAQATAMCTHENIVVLYEADVFQGVPYMVLEHLQGQSLAELLKEQRMSDSAETGRLLSAARTIEIMMPVVRALERAHGMGIVHRDLKPANVMLTDDGVVKVLDFGIAHVRDDSEVAAAGREWLRETVAQQPRSALGLAGTLPYMSPEQLRCEEVDGRTDLWAIGIMLHELVTGEHPLGDFTLATAVEVGERGIPMPRVVDVRPELGKLGAVIDRCLIKSAPDRIGSASELLAELHALAPDPSRIEIAADECPFTGLAAFQEADSHRFFGRESDIVNVVAHVRNQPIVTIAGPSGVGKSSLVRAGVIPALKRSGEGWISVTLRPGRSPFTSLTRLADLFHQSSATTADTAATGAGQSSPGQPRPGQSRIASEVMRDPELLRQHLLDEPGRLGVELRAWAERKRRRVLVFIDQFEEIYTSDVDPHERAAFLACLLGLADDPSSPLRLLLASRADFLERMAADRAFMAAAMSGLMFLAPLSRAGLRQALEKPLELTGYQFESPDIVEAILAEFDVTPGSLPLIQFTASRLWDARDRERKLLTAASYRDMGGVGGTLAGHADRVLAGMNGQQVGLTRAIFERLVTPERTRAIVSLSDVRALPGPAHAIDDVLAILTDARLLVVESRRGAVTESVTESVTGSMGGAGQRGQVEIIHESLITGWPTLTRWLDENREDARFLSRLRAAASSWEKSGRAEGMLWRGDVARAARRWWENYDKPVAARETSYLLAVLELADRAARRKRNLVLSAVAIWTLIVLVVAFVYVEFRSKDSTIDRQDRTIDAQDQTIGRQVARLRVSLEAEKNARATAEQSTAAAEAALQRAEQAREAAIAAEAATSVALEREKVAREAAVRARVLAQQKADDEAQARRDAEDARRAADAARAEAVRAWEAEKRLREQVEQDLARERARIERLHKKLKGGQIKSLGNREQE